MKKIISIVLTLVTLFSLSLTVSAKSDSSYRVFSYNWCTGQTSAAGNQVFVVKGNKKFSIVPVMNYKGMCKDLGISESTAKKFIENHVKFDITVVNPNGTKTFYYGKKPSETKNIPLSLNKNYKIYVNSYLSEKINKSGKISFDSFGIGGNLPLSWGPILIQTLKYQIKY